MEDIILILILLLALFLLVKYLTGSVASKAGTYASDIGSAASTAIKDITAAGSNTAKELGTLAHNIENNVFNGYADATKHSTVNTALNTSTNYKNAVEQQLYPGITTGENAITGPASAVGAAAGSGVFSMLGGLVQGATSGEQAYQSIPAIKSAHKIGADINNWVSTQASDLSHWVGHLF